MHAIDIGQMFMTFGTLDDGLFIRNSTICVGPSVPFRGLFAGRAYSKGDRL